MKKPRHFIAAFFAGCLVAFFLTLFALAATGPGQRMILQIAEWGASSDDVSLKISGLEGSLFSQGRIASLSVSDREGPWVEIENVSFSWSPWALLGGALEVERLNVAKLVVSRTPQEEPGGAAAAEETESGDGGGSFALPLQVKDFAIGEAVLGEPVLGEPARLSVNGQVEALNPAEAIFGAIMVKDLDRPSHIQANVTYIAATDSLEIGATAEDKAGGILSSLLNLSNRPDLRLTLNGSGPIDGWRGRWSLVAGADRLASGALALDRQSDGMRIAAEAKGELSRFVPRPYAALLAGHADVAADARILNGGRYQLERFRFTAPRLTASASGSVDMSQNQVNGRAELRLNQGGGSPVTLAVSDDMSVTIGELSVVLAANPEQDGTVFAGKLNAANLDVAGQKAERVALQFAARQPDDVAALMERLEAIRVSAAIDKPELDNPALRPVAGDRIILEAKATKSGDSFTIENAALSSSAVKLNTKGVIDAESFQGAIQLSMPDAAPLSKLAGRELSGALNVAAEGRAGFDGTFDLTLNGGGEHITAGEDVVGQILAGQSRLDGKVARTETGQIRFDALKAETRTVKLSADGAIGGPLTALQLDGQIAELAQLLPDSSGNLSFEARLKGEGKAQTITAQLTADDAMIRGQRLQNVSIAYDGSGPFEAQRGALNAQGTIGGAQLTGTGQFAIGGEARAAIDKFTLALGENQITADAVLPHSGDANGTAQIQITDAAQLAPILGLPMEGSANVDAKLSGTANVPTLALKAEAASLKIDTIELTELTGAFEIASLLERPSITGGSSIKSLKTGGTALTNLALTAKPDAERTAFNIKVKIDNRWNASGEAVADLTGWQPNATLRTIALQNGAAKLTQDGEAQLSAVDGRFKLDGLALKAGSGRINANVAMDEALSGKVEIKSFPASFVAVATPGMEPRGSIDGTIDLSGRADAPQIAYKLAWKNAFVAGALPPSFPALGLTASGRFTGDDLKIEATAGGMNGLNLKLIGALRNVSSGGTLDLKAQGNAPLALANAFLASRGTRLQGPAAIDLAVTGPAAEPAINGRITASGASVSDPDSGLNLKDLTLAARLSGKTLQIEKLTAASEKGGTLSASGSIGVLEGKTLPIDLQIKANGLRFDDQRIASGEVGSDVAFKGNLNGESKLSGMIDIARLDIQIPQTLPSSVNSLDLQHKNAPDHVIARQPPKEQKSKKQLPSTIALSLNLRSANRIFVKGRGLDALLGGSLQLLGSADQPRAVGEFTLERGRLAILGRTLEFVSGSVNFNGDLDPLLNFLATANVESTRIEVTVSGQASNPKFSFSSNPELPEDEVLALLLFNKSLDQLSPLQIAQLASEVSELTGLSGGPGVLGRLKSSVGIDTLNVTTDEKGDAAVSAGSYLSDQIFVGVEQGSSGDSSRVKVDLDITKNIKLRGETGADGESKLGVGVEWEY